MSNAKIITLGIGIALIFAIFAGFLSWQIGSNAENSCKTAETSKMICCQYSQSYGSSTFWAVDSVSCTASQGGLVGKNNCNINNYVSTECGNNFKQIFGIVALISGIMALALGIFLKTNSAIEGGLIFGGVISLIMSLIAYWDWIAGWGRVVVSAIILVGLIILAWYKTKD